jgi:hypothetical protein
MFTPEIGKQLTTLARLRAQLRAQGVLVESDG